MTTRWKVIVGGLVAATAVSFAAVAFAGGDTTACGCAPDPEALPTTSSEPPSSSDRVITVSGTGTVSVEPDTAIVSLGARAQAATGEEAMTEINTASAGLTEALVAAGIAEEDIQTSRINLQARRDDRDQVTGYEASLNVNVTIRDIDAVGATIDAAQQGAGAGFTISGVTFTIADPEPALEQARIDAGADARRRAEQYADGLGASVGYVVNVAEHSWSQPMMVPAEDAAMEMAADAGPTISPGQLDLHVEISVSFDIIS
ncbi:MAG: SIMPL domain-containing protein [Acidimicrobiales bacterium]